MGTIHALQRRVEVAQQGLALFEEESRGTGARLGDAFGRIEEVLRDKDFQLVRRELEVQRLARENAQARMLLETLLETVEQRKPTSLREVIEEFERKLAASTALSRGEEPPADAGPGAETLTAEPPAAAETKSAEPESVEPGAAEPEPAEQEAVSLAEFIAAQSTPAPVPAQPAALAPSSAPAIAAAAESAASPAPFTAFADPAGDVTVTIPAADEAIPTDDEYEVEEPQAEFLPPVAVARVQPIVDPNEELIADARAQLRSRKGGARLIEEEQRRYAYKIWLGPILIGVGALGPLALVLARISH